MAGGVALSDSMAIWNGHTWLHVDADLPGADIVYSILPTLPIAGTHWFEG